MKFPSLTHFCHEKTITSVQAVPAGNPTSALARVIFWARGLFILGGTVPKIFQNVDKFGFCVNQWEKIVIQIIILYQLFYVFGQGGNQYKSMVLRGVPC